MLGSRLQTVADFVPRGSVIADIGTDHGYLPIELIKSGKCTKAVAADVNEGPLFAAKRSVRAAGLCARIDIRLGSGLAVLQTGEVDIAIFCGMGGNLIRQLLIDSPAVVNSLKGLILQPQQGYSALRRYLYEIGWHIEDEAIAKEDGRIYQVIYAVPGSAPLPSEIELEIGETTEIGDNCTLYQNVTLGGTGKEQGKRHPTLGNNVMVGSGAKVLGPFKVGDNARVAAGAVVLDEVPANATAVGVPARVVRINGVKPNSLDQVHVADPVSQELCRMQAKCLNLQTRLEALEKERARSSERPEREESAQ